jgi:hypothetical protein
MNRQDRQHLLAEKKFLEERLAEIPASAQIMRMSTESRLRNLEERLAQEPVDEREPAKMALTFSGRPVIGGSHGIFADFAMKAVNGFVEAVAAVAASLAAPLAPMGPIPNRDQNQLLITQTVLGSFGFELEEYRVGLLPFEEQTPVELALERTQSLLQGSIEPDDELLADSAAELDPRALEKVRDFIKTLADNEAICALQFNNRDFRFRDVGQIRRSLDRLSRDNLHEEEINLSGIFLGVLPTKRTFEFKLQQNDEIISGKVGATISSPAELNAHLEELATIKVMTTRVGTGKPRYLLLEMPSWQT